jgi:hypothetical protein
MQHCASNLGRSAQGYIAMSRDERGIKKNTFFFIMTLCLPLDHRVWLTSLPFAYIEGKDKSLWRESRNAEIPLRRF